MMAARGLSGPVDGSPVCLPTRLHGHTLPVISLRTAIVFNKARRLAPHAPHPPRHIDWTAEGSRGGRGAVLGDTGPRRWALWTGVRCVIHAMAPHGPQEHILTVYSPAQGNRGGSNFFNFEP
ncbi:unnamed protein product [Boreogadus saida]